MASTLRLLLLSLPLLALACGDSGDSDTSSVASSAGNQGTAGTAGSPGAGSGGASAGASGVGGAAGSGAGAGGQAAGGAGAGQGGAGQSGGPSGGAGQAGGAAGEGGAAGQAGEGGAAGQAGAGGDAGKGGDAGAAGAGGATVCGGFAGFECSEGFYCEFSNNYCGGEDGMGLCQPRPTGCPLPDDKVPPVCGCDQKVYSDPCNAAKAGADVSVQNFCTPPAGSFKCGYLFCAADQLCQVSPSDVVGDPSFYNCAPLPQSCVIVNALPSCGCLGKEQTFCGGSGICTDDGKGAVTVTCPGG